MVVTAAIWSVLLVTGTMAVVIAIAGHARARSERAHSRRIERLLQETVESSLTESERRNHQQRLRALKAYERLVADPYDGGF